MIEPRTPPDPPRPPYRRGWLRPLLLLAVSGTVALVVAELLLRFTGLAPPRGSIFTVGQDRFESIPGIFEPGIDRLVLEHVALPYHVTIDSLGYRGAPVARRPAPDEIRVFFTGDSGTFGSFVDDEETLPYRTETLLNDRCDAPVRVVNAGLGGSTIRDQIELVRRGLVLEPDLVVLMFSENDVRDLIGPSMWQQLADNREAKSRFPLGMVYPVLRHTALWSLALRVRAVFQSRQLDARIVGDTEAAPPGVGATPEDSPLVTRGREAYRGRLVELRDELAARDVPLAFAIFPSHHTLYGHWDSDQFDWAEALGRELGLPTVPLLDPLLQDGRGETELYLLPDDGHPSPEGYAVAANHLASALLASGLLGGACE